ncbi:TPA: hypothetical protein DDZ10_03225 [Candidatus Uhrbacteria bacterium]|nr:hypothetical protein [Candidatus Uhrbacteria bacterium]
MNDALPWSQFYHSPDQVRRESDGRLRGQGVDPASLKFVGKEDSPDPGLHDDQVAIVLVDSLDTITSTFRFIWGWSESVYSRSWAEHNIDQLQPYDVRDISGASWQPMTRRWLRVQMNAYPWRDSHWTRERLSPTSLLCLEPLCVFAQHPNFLRMTAHRGNRYYLPAFDLQKGPERVGEFGPIYIRYDEAYDRITLAGHGARMPLQIPHDEPTIGQLSYLKPGVSYCPTLESIWRQRK